MPIKQSFFRRKVMAELLRDQTMLDSFLIDHFPDVFRRHCESHMDRLTRENQLFLHVDLEEICSRLRQHHPDRLLFFIEAPPREEYPLVTGQRYVIGRDPTADILFGRDNEQMSRVQVELTVKRPVS
jgi:hypothetical protein